MSRRLTAGERIADGIGAVVVSVFGLVACTLVLLFPFAVIAVGLGVMVLIFRWVTGI